MILEVVSSPLPFKRYRATVKTARGIKTYDFGLKGGHTYIDGASDQQRTNYMLRHRGNSVEEQLIDHLVPSPSLLSAYLLWGKYRTLKQNIIRLNALWKKKH
jgi:hypothetical protein